MAPELKLRRVTWLEAGVFAPSTRMVGGAELWRSVGQTWPMCSPLGMLPLTMGVSEVTPLEAEVHLGSMGHCGHTPAHESVRSHCFL